MLFLDRYQYNPATDLLGKGLTSRVYKCFDTKLNREIALKLSKAMHGRSAGDDKTQYIIHENIIRQFDTAMVEKEDAFGESEQLEVMAMELADATAKAYYAANRNEQPELLYHILNSTLDVLQFLHQQQVAHNNIKPSNMLISLSDGKPVVKIAGIAPVADTQVLDFNFSMPLPDDLFYLTPHQINRENPLEETAFAADIWRFGVSAYEIITGEALFRDDSVSTVEKLRSKITDAALPDRLSELPAPYQQLITACLKATGIERPDIDALKNMLKEAQPTAVKEETPVDETTVLKKAEVSTGNDDTPAANNADDTLVIKAGTDTGAPGQPPVDETVILNKSNITAPAPTEAEGGQEGKVTLFNRYEYSPVSNLIGKGGFSRVYKAFDKKLNRWVALKVYKSNELSERYSPFAEIRRVINLDHGNICRYLDIEEMVNQNAFGEKETTQVCVMELMDGGNIAEYYQKNKDEKVLNKLIGDILKGLSYLHRNGIIHRDIKPANILIKETIEGPVAKITDFGISKATDSVNSNSSSTLIVSIPFMAPEQFNVKKFGINNRISYNLDLWSLGVSIYEIYTGKVLFRENENDNSEQIMVNIMSPAIPDKINVLPPVLQKVVARCLVKDAAARVQHADELLGILEGGSHGAVIEKNAAPVAPATSPVQKKAVNRPKVKVKSFDPAPAAVAVPVSRAVGFKAIPGELSKTKKISFAMEETPVTVPVRKKVFALPPLPPIPAKMKRTILVGAAGLLLLIVYFSFISKYMKGTALNSVPVITTGSEDSAIISAAADTENISQAADQPSDTIPSVININETQPGKKSVNKTRKTGETLDPNAHLLIIAAPQKYTIRIEGNKKMNAVADSGKVARFPIIPGNYIIEAVPENGGKKYERIYVVKQFDLGKSFRLDLP